MLRNYIRIAMRNIAKQKVYSFINIVGLSIGIASVIFVLLYVRDELSYDQFHHQIDRMYRIGLNGKIGDQEVFTTNTCPPLAEALRNEVPEVAKATRIQRWDDVVIKYADLAFTEDKMFWADSNFFEVFDFELIKGSPGSALKEPNSIILTESMSRKYFGSDDPMGQLLTIGNNNDTYKVTGIVKDPPSNSHFRFNFLRSMSTSDNFQNTTWLNNYLDTYMVTNPGANLANIKEKLDEMVLKYVGPEIQQYMGISMDQMKEMGGKYGYFIDPVSSIHLYSNLSDELEPGGDIAYVYMFGAIGLFIMLIACINFMNLSTAKSTGRAREVGMRKTFGSLRGSLIGQFLTESMIYSVFGAMIGMALVYLLLPEFNLLAGKQLDLSIFTEAWFILSTISIILLVGLVAGSYPAFYLTSFKITDVLKGRVKSGAKSGYVRSGLVVFQFFISIILITSTIVVYRQIQYTQQKNLGFEKENVIVIENASRLGDNMGAFKNSLSDETSVMAASYSNYVFPGVNNTTIFRLAGSENDHIMGTYLGDHEHIKAMGFNIIEGRDFSRDFPSDSSAVLINEAAVDELGIDDPLQTELIFQGDQKLRVIGVLKNFNFESLKDEIRPIVVRLLDVGNYMTVRFENADPRDAVNLVTSQWEEFAPNEPFEYNFLDDRFNELYQTEQRIGVLAVVLTSIAILIACLGLFGLASFMAERRTKEIGIRKALGASEVTITRLMSWEFVRLVIISFALSILPSYYFMSNWLQGFAYRTEINVWMFLTGGVVALFIAIITVSYQSIRSSLANPVEALKYE